MFWVGLLAAFVGFSLFFSSGSVVGLVAGLALWFGGYFLSLRPLVASRAWWSRVVAVGLLWQLVASAFTVPVLGVITLIAALVMVGFLWGQGLGPNSQPSLAAGPADVGEARERVRQQTAGKSAGQA